DLSEIILIHAETTADAMVHIGNRPLAFIVMDLSLPDLDARAVAAGLSCMNHIRIPPVLLVTDSPRLPDLYDQVPPLLLDHVVKPLDPVLIRAKLLLFSTLFRHRIAMDQSIQELEKVYERFMEQHWAALSQTTGKKELMAVSSAFTNQIQPFLARIQASTYFLLQAPDLPRRLRQGVSQIRTAGGHIAKVIRQLNRSRNRGSDWPALFQDKTGRNRPGRILFATHFKDEFKIFQHYLDGRIKADLFQADTTEQAMASVAANRPDIIFINHKLADGSGLHLLEKLVRLSTRAPVIYTVDKNSTDSGAAAVATGAHTFLIKEQTSGMALADTIQRTLEQTKMTHNVQGAMDRVDLISRRDQLTRLLNRSWFNQTLSMEMSKARRYHLPLSIMLASVDQFKKFNEKYGYRTGNDILTACAARIQAAVRDEDVVCRFAAQKFAVVLPNTGANRARILAERIRQNIFDQPIQVGTRMIHLTLSIGTATFEKKTDSDSRSLSMPAMVQDALTALDRSIQQGGNQVW
ncbi:MAG: diguanylate cyclase, partial [Desulfotignum sp.]|nr:diguanylate cyclase [Desulfotignum sp.]